MTKMLAPRINHVGSDLMSRFFGDDWGTIEWGWPDTFGREAMRIDVRNEEDRYVVEAEVPGVTEDKVDITVNSDVLTISVEREKKQKLAKGAYVVNERRDSSTRRSFYLPNDVNRSAISARMEGGVLYVEIPKAEEAKPRKIEVNRG